MAGGRSPRLSGQRRGRIRGAPTPLAQESNPLPPGTEVEVRIDDEGFYGSWCEATVVGFDPGAGRRRPARYTVDYSHLVAVDGPDSIAPSHVRPRPPPVPSPPLFLLHDIVEAFDCNGWWSVLFVAPAPADPGSPVTVAFPITREVLPFPPNLIRPRRDFVGGEWVPSRAVVPIDPPKRAVRVYKAGEKVQLLREREAYGDSWFPATVAKAVDGLSYIVEYLDDREGGGGKVAVYRHWGYIRPAEYHRPRQSKVRLFPGAAVEVHCDGAWSLGVVRRVVREGCEYEVSVDGEEGELLLTKEVYQVRPQFVWNGRHWTIPTDKRQANLRHQSASEKCPSSPVDATCSDEEHSTKSSTAKKSRKEPQRQELMLDGDAEHSSLSKMGASLSESCKSLATNQCLNSCLPLSEKSDLSVFPHEVMTVCSVSKNGLLSASSVSSEPPEESNSSLNLCPPLSEKNGLSILPRKIVSACSVSKNGLLCALTGQTAPPVASNNSVDSCPLLSENNGLSMLAHKIGGHCSMSKNGLLCASSGNSAPPPDESIPNVIRETEFSQNALSEMVPSNGQVSTPVCGRNVDEACDMLSIQEARRHGITSSLREQQTQERPFSVKALSVKKGISKNKMAHQRKNDASNHMQIQVMENRNTSGKEIICASSASPECQTSLAWTRQVSRGTSSGLDSEGFNLKKLATNEGTGLLDKELAAMVNMICQTARDADVCTDTAATQVTDTAPVSKVDERSILLPLQNAGSSEVTTDNILLRSCSFSESSIPPDLASSQISGYKVPFVKSSPVWSLIDAMDVYNKVPQQPHFHPLREFLPPMRQGMALGLMVTFASAVEDVSRSSITDSIASFNEKIATLQQLEENGFDVQFLQCSLMKLLKMKSDHISYLTEKEQLKAQLLEKTTSLSQIDERLGKKEQTIAKLEEELVRARQEAQKIVEEKEREDGELSRLTVAESSVEEACVGAELQFQSVLAELHRKILT